MGFDNQLRITALILKWIILVLAVLVFLFALFSGAEDQGGGFMGVVRNSPNSIPWLVLFVFVFVLWKRELAGGILLAVFGVFTIFMFNVFDDNIGVFFMISLPLLLSGVFFIFYGLRKKRSSAS